MNDIHEPRHPHGLFSLSGTSRVPLPLKALDARFEVAGDCAQVTIKQLFEFDGPNPVDVIYTFPLPAEATHCGVEIHTVGIDANVNEGALAKIARRKRTARFLQTVRIFCRITPPRRDFGLTKMCP